jgi:DNA-binding NarL/FixJ family response regulator
LLLLDDHVLFREGVSRLLESESDFEVVAQCGTPGEGLDVLARTAVDIVLLDYDLETDTGTRFISAAYAAGFEGRILMVTAGMNELQCSLAWKLGIAGIALKHSSPGRLLEAIRTVAGGGKWNDQEAIARSARPPARALSPRERQVLRGVLEGQTNKEIAHQIGASLSSVKASLQQLFDKAGVRTRGQLVRVAVERSLETTGSR